jgi:hypothetical protein
LKRYYQSKVIKAKREKVVFILQGLQDIYTELICPSGI